METLPQNPASVNEITLTLSETETLERCKEVVLRGKETFLEVGEALATIRDDRLYRVTHSDFGSYCREELGIGRSRAYQLISASEVVHEMSTVVDTLNERQARLVGKLKDRGERKAAVEEAIAVRGKVSPKKLQEAVEKRLRGEEGPERTQWTAEAVAEWKEALLGVPLSIRNGVAELICRPGVGPDHALSLLAKVLPVLVAVRDAAVAAEQQHFRSMGRG